MLHILMTSQNQMRTPSRKDLSKSPTLGRGKQGSKMDMMMMMMKMMMIKFSRARSPERPLERRKPSSRALPVSCLPHSGNTSGVPWPDHFSKTGDGPELGLTVKSRQKCKVQVPIQSSSTSRPKHQTKQAQPRWHLKLEQ